MPSEIPAVDRRYVFWFKRMKIMGVIPIEEMTAESLQPVHCPKRFFQSVDGRGEAEPAKISRGQHREKIEAQICRRGAVGDDWPWILLKIVRRKHMIFRRHERFKEVPGAPRRKAQALRLCVRQRALVGAWRPAHPPCDGW